MLLRCFAANHGGVVTTESEAVVHGYLDLHLAGMIWRVIQVATWIRRIEINGGWYDVVVAAQDGKNHLNASASAERMPQMPLGAG